VRSLPGARIAGAARVGEGRVMAAKQDGVVWTESGRAALDEERRRWYPGAPARDTDWRKAAQKAVKKFAPKWKSGVKKADALGKQVRAFATTWKPGAKATPEQLAGLVSPAACNADEEFPSIVECLIVDYGYDTIMKVVNATWTMSGHYSTRLVWVEAVPPDH